MTHTDAPPTRDERLAIAKKALAAAMAVLDALDAPSEPDAAAEWLSLPEAAALAKTSPRALREAARRGELAAFGRRPVRFRRGDVDVWAAGRPVRVIRPDAPSDDVEAGYRAKVAR